LGKDVRKKIEGIWKIPRKYEYLKNIKKILSENCETKIKKLKFWKILEEKWIQEGNKILIYPPFLFLEKA
jgi:hypothetical protein